MLKIAFGFSISILILSSVSFAKCVDDRPCINMGNGVYVSPPVNNLNQAVASPSDGAKLTEVLAAMGPAAVVKNCTMVDSNVTRVQGGSCGTGTMKGVCVYNAEMACNLNGKQFPAKFTGSCSPMHDCGTFQNCMADNSLTRTAERFREPSDAVYKSSQQGVVK